MKERTEVQRLGMVEASRLKTQGTTNQARVPAKSIPATRTASFVAENALFPRIRSRSSIAFIGGISEEKEIEKKN